jgi:hypothetical protein
LHYSEIANALPKCPEDLNQLYAQLFPDCFDDVRAVKIATDEGDYEGICRHMNHLNQEAKRIRDVVEAVAHLVLDSKVFEVLWTEVDGSIADQRHSMVVKACTISSIALMMGFLAGAQHNQPADVTKMVPRDRVILLMQEAFSIASELDKPVIQDAMFEVRARLLQVVEMMK